MSNPIETPVPTEETVHVITDIPAPPSPRRYKKFKIAMLATTVVVGALAVAYFKSRSDDSEELEMLETDQDLTPEQTEEILEIVKNDSPSEEN